MQAKQYLKQREKKISLALNSVITKTIWPQSLKKAAVYSLQNGKRIRPLFLLATLHAYGMDNNKALPIACSLEILHTYSLIHDDLPAMDDDDMRRGKPSLHKAFPEWLAILTGDAFVTYAFELIIKSTYTASQKVHLIRILTSYAGGDGLIMGQVIDLAAQNKKPPWKTIEKMHIGKTASLFMAAMEMAAIIARQKRHYSLLREIGKNVGLAYQIIDDILDVTSTEKVLGKPIGSDTKKNKPTTVSALGMKKARQMAIALTKKSLDLISSLKKDTTILTYLVHLLLKRKY